MDSMLNEKERRMYAYLFSLLHQVLEQEVSTAADHLTSDEFDMLLKLSKRHEVLPMVAYGLILTGNLTDEQEQRCRNSIYKALVYQERMEQELHRSCELLETAGIPHMPLKGAVIRHLYPEPWFRTSGDIDILVKDVDSAVKLLMENGYQSPHKGSHDVTLRSPNGITIELHFQLIETDSKVNTLLEQVWDRASPRVATCHYEMEPEMFYFYHIAHMAKHMIFGGCGIRFFADAWILNEKLSLDTEKKNQLLREGGLAVFAEQAENLSNMWFGTRHPDPLLMELEHFILNGGVFGSKSNEIKLYRSDTSASIGFLLMRIFKPYSRMALQYPTLKKYPILLPVFWVRRWLSLLFQRKKVQRARQELVLNGAVDDEAVLATKRLFRSLELL